MCSSSNLREEVSTPKPKPTMTTALDRDQSEKWEGTGAGFVAAVPIRMTWVQAHLSSSVPLRSYLCDRLQTGTKKKVRESWAPVPNERQVFAAEPLGEKAQLCMQGMASPHPGARATPAAVCDYALGPSAQGLWRPPCVLLPGRWGGHRSLVNLLEIALDD